jgi:hypothetical protein
MKYFLFIILLGIIFYSCNPDNAVTNQQSASSVYSKINTVESGNVKFEIWSATAPTYTYGYNDIGFKVFVGGVEKTDGFVKFKPLMIHFPGQLGHSCPVSSGFYYNNTYKLFTGYACFSMITDSSSTGKWTGYYNYNNTNYADSVNFTVLNSSNQLIEWDDIQGGNNYVMTLINPKTATLGMNNIELIFHRYLGNNLYGEVDSAEMIIKPWMPTQGQGSGSNVNPASIGSGRYAGKMNLNIRGGWYVYDTIKINNTIVTKIPPPKFNFEVQ